MKNEEEIDYWVFSSYKDEAAFMKNLSQMKF